MKDIDTKRPRRLDLDAPLLSTRRSNITSATSIQLSRPGSLRSLSDGVPFSWEHSPGKPKHAFLTTRHRTVVEVNKVLPLPKPPLVGWQVEDEPTLTSHENDGFTDNITDNADASFSDAIDLFSLEGSFDTDERLDFESKTNGNNYTTNEPWSPSFMIQRFLPAATALAASSLSAIAAANKDVSSGDNSSLCSRNDPNFMAMYSSSNHFSEGSRLPRVTGEAYSSTRGCGFQIFFPWRTKHRLCGVKSPVRRVRSSLKPQLSSRN